MKISKSLKIYGKVQGVGFRFYTNRKANELGLTGFVQNKRDGSVYIEVSGEEEIVDQFVIWCHSGPDWARVEEVKIQDIPYFEFNNFVVK